MLMLLRFNTLEILIDLICLMVICNSRFDNFNASMMQSKNHYSEIGNLSIFHPFSFIQQFIHQLHMYKITYVNDN